MVKSQKIVLGDSLPRVLSFSLVDLKVWASRLPLWSYRKIIPNILSSLLINSVNVVLFPYMHKKNKREGDIFCGWSAN
jgi:hypothetical protein